MQPIRRLAMVNRGEAAMRCIRSAKGLRAREGSALEVVALYTKVDQGAPFVRHADMAQLLPERATAVASYLDHDALLWALRRVEADAVWPGWGFVAESPEFVDRLHREGIRFLGPSADTMRRLGDKISSKELAERVGVPVTAWSGGAVADLSSAKTAAEAIGYPLVVKASAGGGGRGIRMVHEPDALAAAFGSAASEAKTAFGDDRLFLEAMVRGGRHIEVQVVADAHGMVLALGCRDCSVQRRHQKVLEEAPPSGLSDELLQRIKAAAESLAREVGYVGVGTVEFLVKAPDFYFLEMNPRLQVEHGITEEITGTDLVEAQIRIARGEHLSFDNPERGYCIEARVCAEDPDAGFLAAPGRIALFDPALGPRCRVDTGVVAGSEVPPDFDSLIAKVIARGDSREEARARLLCALRDFDLVIEGGATNKGYLIELLQTEDYRRGGVDTLWLDRWNERTDRKRDKAPQALVLAAIVAYRAGYRAERRNFFADPGSITPQKVPDLHGRELDLEHRGEQYRVRVFSVGSERYRVHLDGRAVSARFRDAGNHTARTVISGRYLRAAYDATDTYIQLEVEGTVHRFGRQTAGQVRAGAPSMVVSIDVTVGQQVEAGQTLGMLEAMKMEIGFASPVTGTVTDVRVNKGQQVGAGDLLLVIEPKADSDAGALGGTRLDLPKEDDPLGVLFGTASDGGLGEPDHARADAAERAERDIALDAVNEEIWRTLLGFDIYEPRFKKILELLECPLPAGLSAAFREQLSAVSSHLGVYADVQQLFSRARLVGERGALGASNRMRMQTYLRRMATEGAGVAEEFLELLRQALSHYGVAGLEHSHALERAVLRMFATQKDSAPRNQLILAVLRRVIALVDAGFDYSSDTSLRDTLQRIAAMRGEVSGEIADTAMEAHYRAFEEPELTRRAEQTSRRVEDWLTIAESGAEAPTPPEEVLNDLAVAPYHVFARVQEWLTGGSRWRRVIALSAYLRRLYAPRRPERHLSELSAGRWVDRLDFEGELVLGALSSTAELKDTVQMLNRLSEGQAVTAFELVLESAGGDAQALEEALADALQDFAAQRITVTMVSSDGPDEHRTYVRAASGEAKLQALCGLHPEAAVRVDLARYGRFDLERMWSTDGIYCFRGRAKEDPEDERLIALADVRGRPLLDDQRAQSYIPIFERAFQEAARSLRRNLSASDPRRMLHWNRIVMHMAHPMSIDVETAHALARKLLPLTRHLGLEKTIVRLNRKHLDRPQMPMRQVEVAFTDLASSRLAMQWRRPRRRALVPASPYERRVAAARRRGLIYPYEIVRMLTEGNEVVESELEARNEYARPVLPVGTFEEYDLDPQSPVARAVSVAGRAPGGNTATVVIGIISTPTAKVPEGMRRVFIASDPTLGGLGSLAAPECDRIVAAIDLAEAEAIPVEWLPVSSGARIAMDSGTENLDSVARVVRRIVTFTQAGGAMHLLINGINIGGQSYWDSLATMLMHTRGALVMTPQASMVLTGKTALDASGSVSAEDDVAIGGHDRVMGPNGQAQYYAPDLLSAYRVLFDHYEYTYVVPGESGPRGLPTRDPDDRDVREFAYSGDEGFATIGEIFDGQTNPGRKRPFSMRALMSAVIDQDGSHLERWGSMAGAETAIVWDAYLGGQPICLLGMESRNVPRLGYRPVDGPEEWNGGTLFPQSSKKVARALNAASGNRPAVMLANLSGFDGSPESMRKLQLEYGAEIARAVVNFEGPIIFLVVSRYHGGAYVVFSQALNEGLEASAVEGSYASVIGGGPAATVVFPREVRARIASDPRVKAAQSDLRDASTSAQRAALEQLRRDVALEKRAEVAAEFDSIHSVERAREVGSLTDIVSAGRIRPHLIERLRALTQRTP